MSVISVFRVTFLVAPRRESRDNGVYLLARGSYGNSNDFNGCFEATRGGENLRIISKVRETTSDGNGPELFCNATRTRHHVGKLEVCISEEPDLFQLPGVSTSTKQINLQCCVAIDLVLKSMKKPVAILEPRCFPSAPPFPHAPQCQPTPKSSQTQPKAAPSTTSVRRPSCTYFFLVG